MGPMPVMGFYIAWAWKACGSSVREVTVATFLIVLTAVTAAAQAAPNQADLKNLFVQAGRIYDIDPDLLQAIAEVESGGDPSSVSPKGALGLMQLMPTTASAFSVVDPFDPSANVMGAADFLRYLGHRFANNPGLQGLPVLLAAYNAGPGAVEKYGGIPPFPETREYVRRVMERYGGAASLGSGPAPVLILGGPKPYLIRLGDGSGDLKAEPVVITSDDDLSAREPVAVLRGGQVLVARGTGRAPWLRHGAFRNSRLLRPPVRSR